MNLSVRENSECQQLLWPSNVSLEKTISAVRSLFEEWETHWQFVRPSTVAVKGLVSSSCSGIKKVDLYWRQYGDGKGASFWIGLSKEPTELIHDAFANEFSVNRAGRKSALLGDVAGDAWEDLLGAMIEHLKPNTPDVTECMPPAREFQAWSGAITVEISWCGVELVLVLNSQCHSYVSGIPQEHVRAKSSGRDSRPLSPLKDVIESRPLSLQVTLAECELDLGTLRHLQIGDVIRFSHRLEDPLYVTSQSGENLCAAYLGKEHVLKAVELVSIELK